MAFVKKISAVLDANLGCCQKCMRQSFIFSAAAWIAAFVASVAGSDLITETAIAAAALLTGLWLCHLLAFASRAAGGRKEHGLDRALIKRLPSSMTADRTRRGVVVHFGKAFAFAAMATSFAIPIAARADVPLCVSQNCSQMPFKQCGDCCLCQFNNCNGSQNDCLKTWQNCNGGCR